MTQHNVDAASGPHLARERPLDAAPGSVASSLPHRHFGGKGRSVGGTARYALALQYAYSIPAMFSQLARTGVAGAPWATLR